MKKCRNDLSADYLRSKLSYDPDTGIFIWKKARTRWLGKVAGTINNCGYCMIFIGKRQFLAHRLAWLYVHDRWSADELDHVNGVRADNRISNLRECNSSQNAMNSRAWKPSKAGFRGVLQVNRRFVAQIAKHGKSRKLGTFDTAEEAHAAYCKAARELHGEFARTTN